MGEGGGAASLAEALNGIAPRIVVEARGVVWADGKGLDARVLAERLLARLRDLGVADARAGVAAVPVVAECAARSLPPCPAPSGGGGEGARGSAVAPSPPRVVPRGDEREFLKSLPLDVLNPDDRTRALLEGVGVTTLGELAALDAGAVEVRFGPAGAALWRLARADDRRVLFRPIPPERLAASIDFVDYVLTDPARLVFTANALLGTVTERLAQRGEHARRMKLVLPLADGRTWSRTIRPARPTASRDIWLRLVRGVLERITVPDAVAGMSMEVMAAEPAGVQQGDLFDRGFATAGAVEAAVARLMEDRGPIIVEPEADAHPLIEKRTAWRPAADRVADGHLISTGDPAYATDTAHAGLTLQLLPEPRPVLVETLRRRDHEAPVRLRDADGWRELVVAAGPDRISGGQWEEAYAREYFRCVTDEGVLLWVYRDARDEAWYLHGWWD